MTSPAVCWPATINFWPGIVSQDHCTALICIWRRRTGIFHFDTRGRVQNTYVRIIIIIMIITGWPCTDAKQEGTQWIGHVGHVNICHAARLYTVYYSPYRHIRSYLWPVSFSQLGKLYHDTTASPEDRKVWDSNNFAESAYVCVCSCMCVCVCVYVCVCVWVIETLEMSQLDIFCC